MFCYPLYDGSYFAIGYGVTQKQIALKAHHLLLPHSPVGRFTTDIDYRTPYNGNRYLDIQIDRKIRWQLLRQFEFGAAAGYKRIKHNHKKITEQFFIGPRVDHDRVFSITLGFARQQQQIHEESTQTSNGVMLALYKDFRDKVIVNASATYWFDQWQYAVRLRKRIHDGGVFVGVGWERVNDWWEGDLEVGLQILVRHSKQTQCAMNPQR
jgi:hypothetical protein